ncbi:hypothetical protein E1297_02495 [Roseibium sp. RKSG952]|nr:hypothetical protein [Roseibium sp. RKSG952]
MRSGVSGAELRACVSRAAENAVVSVYCNDLYCAVAALSVPSADLSCFTYDSHELQIDRKRKSGLVRTLVEAELEATVLRRADRFVHVNHRALSVVCELYAYDGHCEVVYNDHFCHLPIVRPESQTPRIIYIGQGASGRLLDELHDLATDGVVGVSSFLLAQNVQVRYPRFIHGKDQYLPELQRLLFEYRCVMWCCNDTSCASYYIATPNKFFQAIAVAIPVIANEGTYLAEIVREHVLGFVYNGSNMQEILERLRSEKYKELQDNIVHFREGLSGDVIRI